MKICHLIIGLENGGAEAVLNRLVMGDNENKHIIISLKDLGFYGPNLLKNNIEVYSIDFSSFTLFKFIKLFKKIKEIKPEILHCWMYHSNLIGALLSFFLKNTKLYWSIHNLAIGFKQLNTFTFLVIRLSAFFTYFCVKKVVYVSESTLLKHCSIGFRKNNNVIIHNGVNTSIYKSDSERKIKIRNNLNLKRDQILIGMVARYDPIKEHELFFKAINILIKKGYKDLKVLLIGIGMDNANNKLIHLLNKYEIRSFVILLGQQNNMEQYYNAMDLHVLPSSSEAFGNVTVEAMSCETPVIVSDAGIQKFIVNDNDRIFKTNDLEMFVSKIECFIKNFSNKQKMNEISKFCRKRVLAHFSENVMIENYKKMWIKN